MVRPPPDPLLSVCLTVAACPPTTTILIKKHPKGCFSFAVYRGLAEILANRLGY